MIIAIFGIFIALSSMTTLRGESPVGLLDIGLVVSSVLSVAVCMGSRRPRSPLISALTANPVYCFLALGGLALIVSTLMNLPGYSIYFIDPIKAILPFLATFFCGIAMAVVLASPGALTLLRSFVIASLLIGLVYIAGAAMGFGPFFYGPRFSGLSLNPNQTAMFALCASLVALVLASKTPVSKLTPVYVAAFVVSMAIGVFTRSDAFMICSVFVVFCISYLVAFRLIRSFVGTVIVGVFAALVLVAAVAVFDPDLFGNLVKMIQVSFGAGNQDSDRELLWRHGVAAWRERPIFGNGAGAWSGISSPFQAIEAHNSFIDWLSMVGFVGALPLAYCVSTLLRLNLKQHMLSYAGVLALTTFFMFHFVFRLPPTWLAWMALLMVDIRPEGTIFPRPWLRASKSSGLVTRPGVS